jgi:redox-sensitive bicupin YhaK (pirin superfamily)
MTTLIPSNQRHYADHGWLKTNWHFSFGDYHDPANMHWGALRVFNDDIVEPSTGFGMHPHRNMEIITYVISGQLTHKDSVGHEGAVNPGEIQVMSAGSGLTHSEYNHSKTTPVHLLQLWVMPRNKGGKPRWAQQQFTREQRLGRLLKVVGDIHLTDSPAVSTDAAPVVAAPLGIDQDASIYVSELSVGQKATHDSTSGRHAYLFVISGEVLVNNQPLLAGDQLRMMNEPSLEIVAKEDSHLILLDLK